MPSRLEYPYFSFDRPPTEHWYLLRSQESDSQVLLLRDLPDANPSQTHSFFALVRLTKIERAPTSAGDFAALARVERPTSMTVVSYTQEPTQRQNQWCIRFDGAYSVVGAPVSHDRPLVMTSHGYRCLHPTLPKTVLEFIYSERGLPEELAPSLSTEGEEFLKGVRIDVAPGTPAQ